MQQPSSIWARFKFWRRWLNFGGGLVSILGRTVSNLRRCNSCWCCAHFFANSLFPVTGARYILFLSTVETLPRFLAAVQWPCVRQTVNFWNSKIPIIYSRQVPESCMVHFLQQHATKECQAQSSERWWMYAWHFVVLLIGNNSCSSSCFWWFGFRDRRNIFCPFERNPKLGYW